MNYNSYTSLFLLLLLSSLSLKILSQTDYQVETTTIENGLFINYANAIIQDSLGFIWMGSDFGLQKYDGYSFTPYLYNSADSGSLGSNSILNLFTDSEKNLWISTRGGLER